MNNTQQTPQIQRTIDGRTYTVLIHFKPDARETAQDKIKRMIENEIRREAIRRSV